MPLTSEVAENRTAASMTARSRIAGAVLSMVGALAFGAASAHETWLMPQRFAASSGDLLDFGLTSGETFPRPDFAIRPERVRHARLRVGTADLPIEILKRGSNSLQLRAKAAGSGWAAASLDLPPKDIVLDAAHVRTYLDDIGADAELRAQWRRMSSRGPWRESYAKSAKTYVDLGRADGDSSWNEPIGLDLELIARQAPDCVGQDGSIGFVLLESGHAAAGAVVVAFAESDAANKGNGTAPRLLATSDAQGRVSFKASRGRRLLVSAVRLHADEATGRWASRFTTLTLLPSRDCR